MARAKKATKAAGYVVSVTANPDFCGVDAGGVQFAHGKAEIADERLANWFKEHEGYDVQAIAEPEAPAETPEAPEAAE